MRRLNSGFQVLVDFESARRVTLVLTQALVLCLIYTHSPSGVVRIYQAKHSCLCYNLYMCGVYISLTCQLTRYTHQYQYVYLVNIPEPVQYHIYAIAFPFDLRCESVTYLFIDESPSIIPYAWKFPRYVNFVDFTVTYRKFNPWKFASLQQLEICNST